MIKLKKMAAVAGAISVVLCWPLAVGQIAQSLITAEIEKLNTKSPVLQIELIEYQRGYWSSTAKIKLSFHLSLDDRIDNNVVNTIINSDIHHGFVRIKTLSTLENDIALSATVATNTLLNGDTDYKIDLEPWHYQSAGHYQSNSVEVAIGHSSAVGQFKTSHNQLDMDLSVPSFEWINNVAILKHNTIADEAKKISATETLTMSNLMISLQGQYNDDFWIGKNKIQFDSFTVVDSNQPHNAISWKQLEYNGETTKDQKADKINEHQQIKLANLKWPNLAPVTDLEMDLEMKQLDFALFKKVKKIPKRMADIQQRVNALLLQGFDFSLKRLNFNYGDEIVKSRVKIMFPSTADKDKQQAGHLIRLIKGDVELDFSQSWLKWFRDSRKVNLFLTQLIDNGFIQKTEDSYNVRVKIQDGKLISINQKEIPIAETLMYFFILTK